MQRIIDRDEVITAMEEAIQKAGRSKYGYEHDIRAMIDRKTGAISLERWTEVVEEIEDDATQMSVDEGKNTKLNWDFYVNLYHQLNLVECCTDS